MPPKPTLLAGLLIGLLVLATLQPAQAGSLAEAVMAELAALPQRSASFVEQKRLASLTAPLVSRGELRFTPASGATPAQLEQDTEAPRPERLVIDGEQLTITAGGTRRIVPLDEHPALRALADTLRAALAGDLAALRRIYAIEEQGTLQAWRLLLVPNERSLRRALTRVTLDGNAAELRQIVIQLANGDEQRLLIQNSPAR